GNLRERSLLSLSVRRCAREHCDFASRLDPHGGAFPTTRGHRLRWAERANLNVTRQTNANQPAVAALVFLFFAQLFVAGKIEGFGERSFVIAAVVIEARRGVKRTFTRGGKVLAPDFD